MSSRDRQRVPVPFGGGLDREVGLMVAPPTTMEDLRNVFLHRGKVVVRRGFERRFELVDSGGVTMTDVLGGHSLRSQRTAVYVGYHQPTGRVEVFRGDSLGQAATHIGQWFTLPAGSAPPVVLMAESYGRVFLAHDHPVELNRAQTFYYESDDDDIHALEGDFGGGTEPVKFRGVARHLEYLWGWGFAGNSQARPEILRVSQPGDPLTFAPEHYFQVGDRDDAIIRGIPAGGTFLAFKETETYEAFGYSRDSFGERIIDPLYGMGISRLAVNVSGAVFAWTQEGPRLYDGSWGSESLELPLELPEPEPEDLVEEGALQYAFAEYMPVERVVMFVFGRRVYALSVRVPGDWKWSYYELGFTPLCGFRLPSGPGGLVTPPTGFPDVLVSGVQTTTTAEVQWDNNGQTGDEFVELWVRPSTGTWQRWLTVPVSLDPTQQATLEALSPGLDYDWAARYRRGPYFTDGYESSNPDDWPAASKGTFSTGLAIPQIDAALWSRLSATDERVRLTISPTHSGVDVEVLRDGLLIHTQSAPTAAFTFDDLGVVGETNNAYTVRHRSPDTVSATSPATNVWGGPAPAPSGVSVTTGTFTDSYRIDWTNGRPDLETEVWDSWEDGVGPGVFPERLVALKPAGLDSHEEVLSNPAPDGDVIEASVRHIQTTFGVSDYSAFPTPDNEVIP